jgi:hypothetical protein
MSVSRNRLRRPYAEGEVPYGALTGLGGIGGASPPPDPTAMRPPRRHRHLLIALMTVGLAGFVGLLALSARLPAHCDVLRLAAFAWFAVFGAARLLVQLDQAVGEPEDIVQNWSRLRGRGDR